MLRSCFIIVNPNSGSRRKTPSIVKSLDRVCRAAGLRYAIKLTGTKGHAAELARSAIADGFETVAVAGGDGTLNEVLPVMAGSPAALGIIPRGSGNGFARGANIPLNPEQALKTMLSARPVAVDLGRINGELFINAAGIGLDAEIGRAFDSFAKTGPRGIWPYVYLGIREYFRYKPKDLSFEFNSQELNLCPLVLTFSNGSQYGGGAEIAPAADFTDGLLNVTLVPCEKWYRLFLHVHKLYTGTVHKVPFVKSFVVKKAAVRLGGEVCYHIDGEPRTASSGINVEIVPSAVKVLLAR